MNSVHQAESSLTSLTRASNAPLLESERWSFSFKVSIDFADLFCISFPMSMKVYNLFLFCFFIPTYQQVVNTAQTSACQFTALRHYFCISPLLPLGETFPSLHTQIFTGNLAPISKSTHIKLRREIIVYSGQKYTVFGAQTLARYVEDPNIQ